MTDYYIGLISGTSMDGVDAALVDLTSQPRLLAHHSYPIDQPLREQLYRLQVPGNDELTRCMRLDVELGRLFVQAVAGLLDQAEISPTQIKAIGSHGQTIRHYPGGASPSTLQLGDPNIIAEQSGITTVADFRRRDMAAGGQGAPLVPAFHAAMFRHPQQDRVILNIGGIANITLLPTDPQQPVSGFDTGPGNGLMDAWIFHNQKQTYDRDGEWAASGSIHPGLLERLLNDSYLAATPPKSTGREYYNLHWLQPMLEAFPGLAPRDVQATLCELTARSIADAIAQYAPRTSEILVCGGGVHNKQLMHRLTEQLSPVRVGNTSDQGLDPDWVEASAFAWLAKQTLAGLPGNLPGVTGASHPVVLGGIYPGKQSLVPGI